LNFFAKVAANCGEAERQQRLFLHGFNELMPFESKPGKLKDI
jgi:hypothetical protein